MAIEIVALRDTFPRRHGECDRCGVTIAGRYESGEVETAAGSFRYVFCGNCCKARRKMSKPSREVSMKRALVNHAARYSPDFGMFVLRWFGLAETRQQRRVVPGLLQQVRSSR